MDILNSDWLGPASLVVDVAIIWWLVSSISKNRRLEKQIDYLEENLNNMERLVFGEMPDVREPIDDTIPF